MNWKVEERTGKGEMNEKGLGRGRKERKGDGALLKRIYTRKETCCFYSHLISETKKPAKYNTFANLVNVVILYLIRMLLYT